nr:hypothetical protein [Tanacetum cinerariifolium]
MYFYIFVSFGGTKRFGWKKTILANGGGSEVLIKLHIFVISPGIAKEAFENKEGSVVSVLDSPIAEEVERVDADDFIANDVFKWRWHGDPQSSLLFSDRYFHISLIAWNSFFAFISGRMGGLGGILKK